MTYAPDSKKAKYQAYNRKRHGNLERQSSSIEIASGVNTKVNHYCSQDKEKQQIEQREPYLNYPVVIEKYYTKAEDTCYNHHQDHRYCRFINRYHIGLGY
jgi:hypothetical protein